MNKELQDKAWSVLPKEFKEEVKKMYCTPKLHSEQYTLLQRLFGGNLTSCTESKEETDKHFDNILKDSFRNERRLNIAAMAMQGILSNPQLLKIALETYQEEIGSPDIYVAVAKTAKAQADALIAECEQTEKLKEN